MNLNARRYSLISSPLVLKPRPLHSLSQKTSSTSSNSSKQGTNYLSERFEIVVPPSSPESLPAISCLNGAPYEEVSAARVQRALSELATAVARTESGISRVVTMREQQAGFVANQLRLLEDLKDEHAELCTDLETKREELKAIEDEITKLQEQDDQRKLKFRHLLSG